MGERRSLKAREQSKAFFGIRNFLLRVMASITSRLPYIAVVINKSRTVERMIDSYVRIDCCTSPLQP